VRTLADLRRVSNMPNQIGGSAGSAVPTPTVDVAPATGAAAGGTAVTITGTGFYGATSARLGGVAITSFVVVNNTTITGVSGAHAAGVVSASVTGPAGTGTRATSYEYT
jgi:hypothetical protein